MVAALRLLTFARSRHREPARRSHRDFTAFSFRDFAPLAPRWRCVAGHEGWRAAELRGHILRGREVTLEHRWRLVDVVLQVVVLASVEVPYGKIAGKTMSVVKMRRSLWPHSGTINALCFAPSESVR